jgi:hypothetical protein
MATNRRKLIAGKFYAVPVKISQKDITIKLPLKVAEYFQLNKPEVYWTPVNGVIQLSGNQPQLVIPMMTVAKNQFVPQPDE